MTNLRKVNKQVTAARADYVRVCAELVALEAEVGGYGTTSCNAEQDAAIARLQRRAGAYRAQWIAAERRAEALQDREDAR